MGTIVARTRKDGSKAFLAQITIKKGGAIVHREAETFAITVPPPSQCKKLLRSRCSQRDDKKR
jgi:hypothetical protein